MIVEVHSKNQIAEILTMFSGCLYTLSTGQVDVEEIADKFYKYAHVIVYRKDDEFAGFAGFYCNDKKDKTAYISLIAVDPNHRNSGIGKALVNEVVKTAKESGMNIIKLEVRKNNQNAVLFYKSLGFMMSDYTSEESYYMYLNLIESA